MARATIKENSIEFEVTALTNIEFKPYCTDEFVNEMKKLNPMLKLMQIETQEDENANKQLGIHIIVETKIVKNMANFIDGMSHAADVFVKVVCDALHTKSETALFYETFKEYSVEKKSEAPEAHDLGWYVKNYANLTPAQKEEAIDLAMNVKDVNRKQAIAFLKRERMMYEEQQSNEEDWD